MDRLGVVIKEMKLEGETYSTWGIDVMRMTTQQFVFTTHTDVLRTPLIEGDNPYGERFHFSALVREFSD